MGHLPMAVSGKLFILIAALLLTGCANARGQMQADTGTIEEIKEVAASDYETCSKGCYWQTQPASHQVKICVPDGCVWHTNYKALEDWQAPGKTVCLFYYWRGDVLDWKNYQSGPCPRRRRPMTQSIFQWRGK